MTSVLQQRWILEFLLRESDFFVKSINKQLNQLILSFPSSVHDHRLLKTLLLRRIYEEIEKGLISEKILESFELIEHLDHHMGVRSLDSMKDAYCAVALDCTVKFLNQKPKNISEFSNALDRIWRGRMCDMESGKEVRLVPCWLKDLKTELEGAVNDFSVCDYISKEDTRNDALKSVELFLEEATEEMGPPFLLLAAEKVIEGDGDVLALDENNGNVSENNYSKMDVDSSVDNPPATTKLSNPVLQPECRNVNEKDKELCKEIGPSFQETAPGTVDEMVDEVQFSTNGSTDDQVGVEQKGSFHNPSGDLDENNGNVSEYHHSNMDVDSSVDNSHVAAPVLTPECRKVTEKDKELCKEIGPSFREPERETVDEKVSEVQFPTNGSRDDQVLTPEFRKVQEALKSSILDLNDVVKDPLPDALCMAATVSANMAKEGVNNLHTAEIQNEVDIDRCDHFVDKECEDVQGKEINTRSSTAVSRPSIMERNKTARTFEWDDDDVESSEGSVARPRLPTPKSRIISPLKKKETGNITGRRKVKKWSSLEEQTLIDAVQEYGRGNWKRIMDNYSEIFEERTVIDLKDKWRNLTK